MKIINRKAGYDYELSDRMEAGVRLVGSEVKAVRLGKADLTGSFVRIIGTEAYLVNANIFPYEYARPDGYDARRTRKLLMHKKQIIALRSRIEGSHLTVVPISLYTSHNFIKLEIALARSKKKFEKREEIKKRDIDRQLEEAIKNKI